MQHKRNILAGSLVFLACMVGGFFVTKQLKIGEPEVESPKSDWVYVDDHTTEDSIDVVENQSQEEELAMVTDDPSPSISDQAPIREKKVVKEIIEKPVPRKVEKVEDSKETTIAHSETNITPVSDPIEPKPVEQKRSLSKEELTKMFNTRDYSQLMNGSEHISSRMTVTVENKKDGENVSDANDVIDKIDQGRWNSVSVKNVKKDKDGKITGIVIYVNYNNN